MLSCSCTCLMTSDGRWHKNIELDRSTGSKMKQRWSRKPNSKLIFFYIQHWPRKHFDEWMHDRNMQFPSGSLFLRKLIFVVKLEFQQMQIAEAKGQSGHSGKLQLRVWRFKMCPSPCRLHLILVAAIILVLAWLFNPFNPLPPDPPPPNFSYGKL